MKKLTKHDHSYVITQRRVSVTIDKFGTSVRADGIRYSKSFDSSDTTSIAEAVIEAHNLLNAKLAQYNYLNTKDDINTWLTDKLV